MILSGKIQAKGTPVPPITKKDISDALADLHGKAIQPQFDRLNKRLDDHDKKFADLLTHFDQIYTKLGRLETEYYTITAGLQRLENRMERLEGRMGGLEDRTERIEGKLDKEIGIREQLEKEVSDLKQRVIALQARIEELENHLKTMS
jgi:chromosome segregation ATPase